MGLSIGISSKWVKKEGDCGPCYDCLEPIYGVRFNMEITVASRTEETKINLCEPCYTKMKDNENIR